MIYTNVNFSPLFIHSDKLNRGIRLVVKLDENLFCKNNEIRCIREKSGCFESDVSKRSITRFQQIRIVIIIII